MSIGSRSRRASVPTGSFVVDECVADEHVAARGADGFEVLYRRHQPMVYRFCLGMLRAPEAAADADQSTWMQVLVALSRPATVIRNVRAWLRAIARNECLDVLRAGGVQLPLDLEAPELSAGSTPEGAYEIREQLEFMLADLRALSERQRAAIVLREICGLSSDELADMLETTRERASGLVADARRTLGERESGRLLGCDQVRHHLLRGPLRTIGLRAHLEVCGSCQSVQRPRPVGP